MKILKTASGNKLKLSKKEWDRIGKEAGWAEERRERGACPSCEVVMVNGIRTHEQGCPDAWMDVTRECKWCGVGFKPSERDQILCSDDCSEAYN